VTATMERELVILLVEDNAADVYMVREAISEAGIQNTLHVVRDGAAAMEFLRDRAVAGPDRPDLVILDLNLPRKNGREVMAEIQAAPELKDLPVAVLTTSHGESEIGKDFPNLRSTYAAKTSDFSELVEIIRRFRDFARQPA
jgi:CheY-like chemotaxis protein